MEKESIKAGKASVEFSKEERDFLSSMAEYGISRMLLLGREKLKEKPFKREHKMFTNIRNKLRAVDA